MAIESNPLRIKVKKEVVGKGIRALVQIANKKNADANQLFEESRETMTLLFNLSRVPEKSKMNPTIIPLPHPMFTAKSEVCFIANDPSKPTKELLMEKFPTPGLVKVLSFDKLKRNYKTLEEKRNLADSFDLFLCEQALVGKLPEVLGSTFYKKKKMPIGVVLPKNGGDPRERLAKILGGTTVKVPTGPTVGVRIGKLGMPEEQLIENAIAVIRGVAQTVKDNPIQGITVQATECPALPLWRRPVSGELMSKAMSDATSSAASETEGGSEVEGAIFEEAPSDAGETLSTRDTVSDMETPTQSELDSEAGDVDVSGSEKPLLEGLKKKRKRGGADVKASPKESPKASPKASPKKAAKQEEMAPPAKKAKKAKGKAKA